MLKTKQPHMNDIACAKGVIDQEIEGLKAVAQSLDECFIAVVDTIASLKGRLIVAGMGKSGHIARKMAATMAWSMLLLTMSWV